MPLSLCEDDGCGVEGGGYVCVNQPAPSNCLKRSLALDGEGDLLKVSLAPAGEGDLLKVSLTPDVEGDPADSTEEVKGGGDSERGGVPAEIGLLLGRWLFGTTVTMGTSSGIEFLSTAVCMF